MSRQNMIAGVAGILMTAALITALFTFNANKNLKNDLSTEKLSSEKLLAEKLLLDKEIVQYNKQIAQFNLDIENLNGKNVDLSHLLADTKTALTKRESELRRLVKENAAKKSIEKDLSALKKQNMGYNEQITGLNNQLMSYSDKNALLNEENNALKQKVSTLEDQNKALMASSMTPSRLTVSDNYLVEGLKGKKDKLTLVARNTKKLTLYINVPEDIASNLKYRIIAPDGKKTDKADKTITSTILNQSQHTNMKNANQKGGALDLTQRVKMEYAPGEKFKKGYYKIEIFDNDAYLNSCYVHLK